MLRLRVKLLFLLFLPLLVSCDQGHQVERGGKPEAILEGGHIIYDGKPLKVGGPMDDWLGVLGSHSRGGPGIGPYLWDGLGIKIAQNYSSSEEIVFVLNHRPPPEYNFEKRWRKEPGEEGGPVKNTFSGYLEIGGVGIDSQTTVEDINMQIDYPYGLTCSRGMNMCSALVGEEKQLIAISVDGRKEKSPVYSIAFIADPVDQLAE